MTNMKLYRVLLNGKIVFEGIASSKATAIQQAACDREHGKAVWKASAFEGCGVITVMVKL
jgi:hypothetical protein